MLRALLATIFAVLTASAALAVDRSSVPAASQNQFAAKFDPAPAHQGQDQIDIDKQPCFSPHDWNGKVAVKILAAFLEGRSVPVVAKVWPQQHRFLTHVLFLYACAPRAPPPSVFQA